MEHQPIRFKIVENEQDQMKAFLVRGIVYLHEQNCPYVEEFDLNDFTATQVLGTIGEEPVATARIRYFREFAKLERLAIRPQFRSRGRGHELLEFLLEFCSAKGYTDIYLHAQERLLKFYESHGFRRIGEDFYFSDHDYIEMHRGNAAPSKDPLKWNRPEGRLEKPGPIERSLWRPTEKFTPTKKEQQT